MHNNRSLSVLKTLSYVLAGLVFAIGLVAGISLTMSAGNVSRILLPLQLMGAGPLVDAIAPSLINLVSGLGIFTLVTCLVLSLLLFVTGRLLGHIASLEVRLANLEVNMESA